MGRLIMFRTNRCKEEAALAKKQKEEKEKRERDEAERKAAEEKRKKADEVKPLDPNAFPQALPATKELKINKGWGPKAKSSAARTTADAEVDAAERAAAAAAEEKRQREEQARLRRQEEEHAAAIEAASRALE